MTDPKRPSCRVDPLVGALREQARDVAFFPAVGNTNDLQERAHHLANFVDVLLEDTGVSSVGMVGSSASGVVALLWVRDGCDDAVARRVFVLASPHHGTDVGVLATEAAGCLAATTSHGQLPDSPVVLAALPTVLGTGPLPAPASHSIGCGS